MKITSNNNCSNETLAQVLCGGGVNAPWKIGVVTKSSL